MVASSVSRRSSLARHGLDFRQSMVAGVLTLRKCYRLSTKDCAKRQEVVKWFADRVDMILVLFDVSVPERRFMKIHEDCEDLEGFQRFHGV